MNLPEATRQHMMDQGFAPRTFAMPAAFLHFPGPNLQSQNIRNRKCFKTQEKFNCGRHLIGSLWSSMLSPQPRSLPGAPSHSQKLLPFPITKAGFSWNGPENKGRPFCILRTLMNCSYWGQMASHDPLLSAFYRHREAQSNSSTGIRCMPGAYRCPSIGVLPKQGPARGIPVVLPTDSSRQPARKLPSTSGLPFPTQYTLEILSLCPLRALSRKICPSVLSPKAAHVSAARAGVYHLKGILDLEN